jgi:DNA-3-methyladenine glycosylase
MDASVLADSLTAAKAILGYELVYNSPAGKVSGYIVETEAYNQDDPASHAFGGRTIRNAPMFGGAGTIYVYFIYGMHYCMNIVTGPEDRGEAVLIRALEPVRGVGIMKRNRGMEDKSNLTNGPGKLAQALGIIPDLNGQTIFDGPVSLVPGFKPNEIVSTSRVGISRAKDEIARFYILGNKYVSRR